MLGLAQRSQDELFHIALYNWLIQADLTDKLLEVVSSHMYSVIICLHLKCKCKNHSKVAFAHSYNPCFIWILSYIPIALCISKVSNNVSVIACCLSDSCPFIFPLLSRWILLTWRNTWCIWSSRTRARCTIWTCCGATTRRTVTLARQLMYWPASLTCTGLDTQQ